MENIKTASLIRMWRDQFRIDVSEYFVGIDNICLSDDPKTGLLMFNPPVVGEGSVYSELEKFDWYYLNEKWEFDVALQRMPVRANFLEIGCGRGGFMHKAINCDHTCIGLELNPSAVTKARKDGLDVRNQYLSDFAKDIGSDRFDRVISFQVLEHVPDPVGLIVEMMDIVRSGGCVCFAVPNASSFIRHAGTVLDYPPHHISRWSPGSIRKIGKLVGARSVTVIEGPLEPIHYGWYTDILVSRLPKTRIVQNRYIKRIVASALRRGFSRFIKGHSVYAEFSK